MPRQWLGTGCPGTDQNRISSRRERTGTARRKVRPCVLALTGVPSVQARGCAGGDGSLEMYFQDASQSSGAMPQLKRLGGGTGGDDGLIPAGSETSVNVTGGVGEAGGKLSETTPMGSISCSSFPENGESGARGLFPFVSCCSLALILQQRAHGFSPLKVSLAACTKPSSFE